MTVVGKRTVNRQPLHKYKRRAIRKGPRLVWALFMKAQSVRKQFMVSRDNAARRGVAQRLDHRVDARVPIRERKIIGSFDQDELRRDHRLLNCSRPSQSAMVKFIPLV